MTKKNVLFCIENYKHGGIPKALESLFANIDHNKLNLHIFCINQEKGPYKKTLQKYVVNKQNKWLWAFSTYYTEHNGFVVLWLLLLKAIRKVLIKLIGTDLFYRELDKEAKYLSVDSYDVVVAYSEGTVTRFVSKIECKKRIAWVHIDYKRNLRYIKNADETEFYKQYNQIVIPSRFSRESFKEVFPFLSERAVAIPNLLDEESIRKMAVYGNDLDERFVTKGFIILSVGRICYEKQFFKIPEIASQLKKYGHSFRWYIIGGGAEEEVNFMKENVRKEAVEDVVILLGAKNNPYPYIKQSNVVVCTSLSETFSYVIGEAKVLGVPVVANNFGSVREVLNDEQGVICSIDNMAPVINKLITDVSAYTRLKDNLKNYSYDNKSALSKIYDLLLN